MKIVLSGGGTLGPVTPLLAIASAYKKHNPSCQFFWVGTRRGPERVLVESAGIDFTSISAGKFRRYFSFYNLSDFIKIAAGFFESIVFLKKVKPDLLITAGGFVSVPLHWAAFFLGVPAWVHQQDAKPGLANKMMAGMAGKVTVALDYSAQYFDPEKTERIGNPCRDTRAVSAVESKKFFGINDSEPVILAMGGGTGAAKLNSLVLEALPLLPKSWHVIHIVGVERSGADCEKAAALFSNYRVYKFLKEELFFAYAAADVIVSRAGFGSLTELASLSKPAIILPISDTHQEENAGPLAEAGAIILMNELVDTGLVLAGHIRALMSDPGKRQKIGETLHASLPIAREEKIVEIINHLTNTSR